MKKLVLTSIFAAGIAGAAFAQGVVEWNAIVPTYFTAVTNTTQTSYLSPGGVAGLANGTTGATAAVLGGYYYELLYNTSTSATAPTTKAALETWSDTGLEAESAASAGKATIFGASSTAATVPFTSTAEVMLVGWSANLGSTWAAASSLLEGSSSALPLLSFFGESSIGTITPQAAGSTVGSAIFGPSGGSTIFSPSTPLYAVVVPEPTTLALGAMGALSLLALRRKKA